jgi:hypothetical protein
MPRAMQEHAQGFEEDGAEVNQKGEKAIFQLFNQLHIFSARAEVVPHLKKECFGPSHLGRSGENNSGPGSCVHADRLMFPKLCLQTNARCTQ